MKRKRALFAALALCAALVCAPYAAAESGAVLAPAPVVQDGITLEKTAERLDEKTYAVTLRVTGGGAAGFSQAADVVLVLESGSAMASRAQEGLQAACSLVQAFTQAKLNVRVGVVRAGADEAQTLLELTPLFSPADGEWMPDPAGLAAINDALKAMRPPDGQAADLASAVEKAQAMLAGAGAPAQYLVLVTAQTCPQTEEEQIKQTVPADEPEGGVQADAQTAAAGFDTAVSASVRETVDAPGQTAKPEADETVQAGTPGEDTLAAAVDNALRAGVARVFAVGVGVPAPQQWASAGCAYSTCEGQRDPREAVCAMTQLVQDACVEDVIGNRFTYEAGSAQATAGTVREEDGGARLVWTPGDALNGGGTATLQYVLHLTAPDGENTGMVVPLSAQASLGWRALQPDGTLTEKTLAFPAPSTLCGEKTPEQWQYVVEYFVDGAMREEWTYTARVRAEDPLVTEVTTHLAELAGYEESPALTLPVRLAVNGQVLRVYYVRKEAPAATLVVRSSYYDAAGRLVGETTAEPRVSQGEVSVADLLAQTYGGEAYSPVEIVLARSAQDGSDTMQTEVLPQTGSFVCEAGSAYTVAVRFTHGAAQPAPAAAAESAVTGEDNAAGPVNNAQAGAVPAAVPVSAVALCNFAVGMLAAAGGFWLHKKLR